MFLTYGFCWKEKWGPVVINAKHLKDRLQGDIDPPGILDKGTKRRKGTLHQLFNHDGQFSLDKIGKFFGRYPRCRVGEQGTERGCLVQRKKEKCVLGHSILRHHHLAQHVFHTSRHLVRAPLFSNVSVNVVADVLQVFRINVDHTVVQHVRRTSTFLNPRHLLVQARRILRNQRHLFLDGFAIPRR